MDTLKECVKAKEEVIGKDIKNKAKDNLGSIYDIVLDKISGKTLYVVLESGSFLGMGGKLFAIPWNAFHFNRAENCFILDVDKERLSNAPGFDKNNSPDMADQSWSKEVADYYEKHYIE